MAKGYHATLRFDKAIETFKKYLKTNTSNNTLTNDANRRIEMCLNAKELVKEPVNVTFENLGQNVNSKGKDYLPLIVDQETYLLFTTRREGTTGKIYDLEGYYTADIYTSKFKTTAWSKAIALGYPNSYGNEQTAGVSENGEIIFYYVNNPESKNNLQIAEKAKSTFKKAELVKGKQIASKSSEQISATITDNKDLVIYSSNTIGGNGGFDLYLSRIIKETIAEVRTVLEEEFKQERKKNSLPVGSHISYENVEYTIHRYLGAGYSVLSSLATAP